MKNKRFRITDLLIKAVLLAFSCGFFTKLAAKEISVTDFGAVANDGKDDTEALRKAAAYCREHSGTTLLLPPGVYILKDEDAEKLEQDAMAGKFGSNTEKVIFSPYYPYSKGLDLNGTRDITIIANGATLLCEGWMEPVSIENSANLTLKGLTIDYKRKPFSHGEIVAIEENWFDIRFSPERIMDGNMPMMRMTIWDRKRNGMYPRSMYFPKKEFLGDNVVRIFNRIPKDMLGSDAAVVHSFHFRPAILIHRSANTVIENVTIHSQPGMGIVGFDSKDILLKELRVIPAPGYYFSTNTDATHFACCEGLLRFEGCVFQGSGDDATNVHGYYQTIVSATGNEATLQVKAPTGTHAQVLDAPRVGDVLELVEISTLKTVKEYRVEKVVREEKACTSSVVLSDDLPVDFMEYYLMNITKLPRLEFVNSFVNSHLSRGVLVKTRDVLIENNVFRYCYGTAILVAAEGDWHEGTYAKNVTIRGNTMVGSGTGGRSAPGIAVNIQAKDTDATYLHDNILIENNTIVAGEGSEYGIYIGNAKNVTLKNNQVSNCKENIHLHSVTNINIKD